MIKINSLEELRCSDLDVVYKEDIFYRIACWLSDGGSINDDYIKKQFQYAERLLNNI